MSTRLDDVELRDFRPDDVEAVLALRARVFPAGDLARERRRWKWEFDENPFRSGRVPSAWVLERRGTIVGNYGLVPTPVSIDGKVELCFNGIDIAVAPELQGRGLGAAMIARHLDPKLCRFPFITAPAPAVAHLVVRSGGTVVRAADEQSVFVLHDASSAPASATRPPSGVALRPIESFDRSFDALAAKVAARHRIQVARDHRYLDWRYRDYPFGRPEMVAAAGGAGELRGFLVLQHDRAKGVGYLLELFAAPDDEPALLALIAGAKEIARARGIVDVYALARAAPAQEQVQGLLIASGFTSVEEKSLALAFRLPRNEASAPPFTPADVYWSPGDGDLLFGIGGTDG